MRRRLMAAILPLVAATLVLAATGSLLLIRRASANTAEQQLYAQAVALADFKHPGASCENVEAVKYVGQYTPRRVVGLAADGTFTGNLPPEPSTAVDLRPGALQRRASRWPARPATRSTCSSPSTSPRPRRPPCTPPSPTRTPPCWWPPAPGSPRSAGSATSRCRAWSACRPPRRWPTGWPGASPGRW